MTAFELGKPAPYYCKACQAVPQAGYCKMAGCPTAPAPVESKHTPGPWSWVKRDGEFAYLRYEHPEGGGEYVLSPEVEVGDYGLSVDKSLDVSDANARLIAKAPDMLAELKWCLMGCGDRERIANLIAEAEGK